MLKKIKKLFKSPNHDYEIVREAILGVRGYIAEEAIESCMDLVHHNEPDVAISLLLDRILDDEVAIPKSSFEKLEAAVNRCVYLQDQIHASFAQIRVLNEQRPSVQAATILQPPLHDMTTLDRLTALYERASGGSVDEAVKSRFHHLLADNGFSPGKCDLDWFCQMLDRVLKRDCSVPRVFFDYPGTDPDVYNLLAELEKAIPARWVNHGDTIDASFSFGISFSLATADYYDIWESEPF